MTDNARHLLNLFHAAYSVRDTEREGDTNLHISNLINFCPRAYFICKTFNRPVHGSQSHPLMMKYTFDMGHALQAIQVRRLMSQNVIFGSWKCRHCGYHEVGMQEHRRPCPKCKCKAWKYHDLGIELRIPIPYKDRPDQYITVRGNVDFVVATDNLSGYIVDAKSLKAEAFDVLVEPHIDYKRQVQLYMWAANRKGRQYVGNHRDANVDKFTIDGNSAVVSYCVKGARPQPYKPYVVTQDRPFIRTIENKLQLLAKGIASGKIPDMICTSQANSLAKACTARTICFGQE